ncbi:LOG family protein [Nocardioides sp.]|uniref:LOG family protein n=1 Tax=Nocardioides sp. TaxID=35761 RepID=UPI002B27963A|nr:LOG family protein [Nocardioides sp.]
MKRTHGRVVRVDTLEDLDRRLEAGTSSLRAWRVHGLDLRGRGANLLARDVSGATFLGCRFDNGYADHLEAGGALVLPEIGASPLEVYRPGLYSPDELFDTPRYADSLDARAYSWTQRSAGRDDLLAAALHDHAIDEALATWVRGRHLVGVMGGHALRRGSEGYADAARLGALLGASRTVATGGGPGAMEAANLGARLSAAPAEALTEALEVLARTPSFVPSIDAWVSTGRQAAAQVSPQDTLGIPTWHYGHEPPNVFATAIAKFVDNAQREAILLEICDAGIVFLPGAGGTVQEIFQDACENYYADEVSAAPMVLVGRTYWTDTLPVWPLLQALARGRVMESMVHLVDTPEEAAALVEQHGSAD